MPAAQVALLGRPETNCWLLTIIALGAVVWAKHYVAHDGDDPLAGRHRRLAA